MNLIIIFVLLTFYILQINAEVSQQYQVQQYEKKISEISKENQELEIKLTQANSLEQITGFLGVSGFEKVDKIHYIKILDGQVVAK